MVGVRSQPTLGDYLLREGIISQTQLNQALDEQLNNSRSIGRILVDKAFITESLRMNILQKRFGFELVSLKDKTLDPRLFLLIPYAFAEKHRVVPIDQEPDRTLVVAMEDPTDAMVLDTMRTQLGRPVRPVVASQEDLQQVLDQYSLAEATREEEQQRVRLRQSRGPRLLRWLFLPVMVPLPLGVFYLAMYTNLFDLETAVNKAFRSGTVTTVDMVLYIGGFWGIWSFVMYEIYGLLFRPKKPAAEEPEAE